MSTYLISNPKGRTVDPTKLPPVFELGISSFRFIKRDEIPKYDYAQVYQVEGSGCELAFPGTRVTLNMHSFLDKVFDGFSRGRVHPSARSTKTIGRRRGDEIHLVEITTLLVQPPASAINVSFDLNLVDISQDEAYALRKARRAQNKKKNPLPLKVSDKQAGHNERDDKPRQPPPIQEESFAISRSTDPRNTFKTPNSPAIHFASRPASSQRRVSNMPLNNTAAEVHASPTLFLH